MPPRITRVAKTPGTAAKARAKRKTTAGLAQSLNMSSAKTTPNPDPKAPIYFWRETHPETGWLSQWWPCAFRDDAEPNKVYKTAEQYGYMMHQKALVFSDPSTAAEVLATGSPRKVKALGRRVRNFSDARWNAERERVVERGTYLKFTAAVTEANLLRRESHPDAAPLGDGVTLRGLLLSTGERELVEASPFDRVWGVGFAEADAEGRRDEWGENLLGKALMRVRERLRREDEERGAKAQADDGEGRVAAEEEKK